MLAPHDISPPFDQQLVLELEIGKSALEIFKIFPRRGRRWLSGPLAEELADAARERLQLFTRTTDGFELAELDARLRGLGELFGTRQHGLGELSLTDLIGENTLLQEARKEAHALVAADADLRRPEHAALRRRVLERYGETLELVAAG